MVASAVTSPSVRQQGKVLGRGVHVPSGGAGVDAGGELGNAMSVPLEVEVRCACVVAKRAWRRGGHVVASHHRPWQCVRADGVAMVCVCRHHDGACESAATCVGCDDSLDLKGEHRKRTRLAVRQVGNYGSQRFGLSRDGACGRGVGGCGRDREWPRITAC